MSERISYLILISVLIVPGSTQFGCIRDPNNYTIMAHVKDEVAKMLSRCQTFRLCRTGINRTDAIVVETQKDDQQRGTAVSDGLLLLGKHKSKTFEQVRRDYPAYRQ